MDKPTKRDWSRPVLIVLMRSGPEETVLAGCKTASASLSASIEDSNCYVEDCTQWCLEYEVS
jgi:hypothetical protein